MRTAQVASGAVAALLAPLVLASFVASGSLQEPEPRPVLFYREIPVVEGHWEDALELWSRHGAHFGANYHDDQFGASTEGVLRAFVVYPSYQESLETAAELAVDEGWQALQELGRDTLLEERSLHLFPLGGADFDGFFEDSLAVLRVTRSPFSKVPEARNFARRVADHLEATYPGMDASTYSADLDDPTAIYWIFDHRDLAAWEHVRTLLVDDEIYLDLYREAEGLFLDDETTEVRIR
jgi:hypothetical protein